jgi:hypothetical protein
LKAIETEYPDDVGTSLETYIADLEAKQPQRPAQISAILKRVDTDHPLDMGLFLEGYVSDLEAKQQAKPARRGISSQEIEGRYWHGVKREQQHRARALRKQNNAQKT